MRRQAEAAPADAEIPRSNEQIMIEQTVRFRAVQAKGAQIRDGLCDDKNSDGMICPAIFFDVTN